MSGHARTGAQGRQHRRSGCVLHVSRQEHLPTPAASAVAGMPCRWASPSTSLWCWHWNARRGLVQSEHGCPGSRHGRRRPGRGAPHEICLMASNPVCRRKRRSGAGLAVLCEPGAVSGGGGRRKRPAVLAISRSCSPASSVRTILADQASGAWARWAWRRVTAASRHPSPPAGLAPGPHARRLMAGTQRLVRSWAQAPSHPRPAGERRCTPVRPARRDRTPSPRDVGPPARPRDPRGHPDPLPLERASRARRYPDLTRQRSRADSHHPVVITRAQQASHAARRKSLANLPARFVADM